MAPVVPLLQPRCPRQHAVLCQASLRARYTRFRGVLSPPRLPTNNTACAAYHCEALLKHYPAPFNLAAGMAMNGFMPPMPMGPAMPMAVPGPRGGKAVPMRGGRNGDGGHKKKKKVQRGLESNVRRTVYISYIDQQVRRRADALALPIGLCCHGGSRTFSDGWWQRLVAVPPPPAGAAASPPACKRSTRAACTGPLCFFLCCKHAFGPAGRGRGAPRALQGTTNSRPFQARPARCLILFRISACRSVSSPRHELSRNLSVVAFANVFARCCCSLPRSPLLTCCCPVCLLLQVTEEQLAEFFSDCGQVVDCRVCGDPNSAMRFAFIEYTDEASAKKVSAKT